MIKTYEQFDQSDASLFKNAPLALPPHETEDERKNKPMVMSLKELYNLDHKDIIACGNRIKAICESSGRYIRLRHIGTSTILISQNEPFLVFGAKAGHKVTVGKNHGVEIIDDSIVINVKADDSLFILSTKEMYEFTFIQPKVIVSKHDPYGEEDWDDH